MRILIDIAHPSHVYFFRLIKTELENRGHTTAVTIRDTNIISQLLRNTLEFRRGKFCDLILEIVQTGMIYLSNKSDPITREDILDLNSVVQRIGFKIPEYTWIFLYTTIKSKIFRIVL